MDVSDATQYVISATSQTKTLASIHKLLYWKIEWTLICACHISSICICKSLVFNLGIIIKYVYEQYIVDLCLGHIHRPTGFIGRHLGVFCILLSNHHRETFFFRCGWFGTHDLDDRPSSADNPKTVCRGDGVKLRPSIGMLSADVCQASVGSPPTSTNDGPMFKPLGRRSVDKPDVGPLGRCSGGISGIRVHATCVY
jgi:hypothetical protein